MNDADWKKLPGRVGDLEKGQVSQAASRKDLEDRLALLEAEKIQMDKKLSAVGKIGLPEISKIAGVTSVIFAALVTVAGLFVSNNTADIRTSTSELLKNDARQDKELETRQGTLTILRTDLTQTASTANANKDKLAVAGGDRFTGTDYQESDKLNHRLDQSRVDAINREFNRLWTELYQVKGAKDAE